MIFRFLLVLLVSLAEAACQPRTFLLRLDNNLLFRICEYDPSLTSLLRTTCKTLQALPRTVDEASWKRLNLPRFEHLPYHPIWKVLQNFPPLHDVDTKTRYILYFAMIIQVRLGEISQLEEQVGRLMVEEIVAEGPSFLRRLLKIRAVDRISWTRIEFILYSLVKRG